MTQISFYTVSGSDIVDYEGINVTDKDFARLSSAGFATSMRPTHRRLNSQFSDIPSGQYQMSALHNRRSALQSAVTAAVSNGMSDDVAHQLRDLIQSDEFTHVEI